MRRRSFSRACSTPPRSSTPTTSAGRCCSASRASAWSHTARRVPSRSSARCAKPSRVSSRRSSSARRRRSSMPAETHVGRSPISPDEVLRMIRERLGEILEIDESRITLDSNFTDDLDADSLALIELVEALEEELGERTVGFSFDDEDLADLHTVRDAVDYVVARLGATEE